MMVWLEASESTTQLVTGVGAVSLIMLKELARDYGSTPRTTMYRIAVTIAELREEPGVPATKILPATQES
jgi:hypothetical protein